MRSAGLILGVLTLVGCSSGRSPSPVLMTPSSRLIYHDTEGHSLWSICDRGARVYMTQAGNFWVVPGACLGGEP